MSWFLKVTVIFGVVLGAVSFLPEVQLTACGGTTDCLQFPTGVYDALQYFFGTMHDLVTLIPFLEVPLQVVLMAVSMKFLLFAWSWIKWFIQLLV